jgi:hypothetical protein
MENSFEKKVQEDKPRNRSIEYPFDKSTKEMSYEEYGEFLEWVAFDWSKKEDSFELRETKLEISDYLKRVEEFESKYNLGELHDIIDLNPEDAPNHPVRESARKALIPIVAQLNILGIHRVKNRISKLEYDESIKEAYMRLSRAVGIINNRKVDHNR